MKKLTIVKSKWVRGGDFKGFGATLLLNSLGNRCCIGFACKDAKIKNKVIKYEGEVSELDCDYIDRFENHFPNLTQKRLRDYYRVNDQLDLTDKQRIATLKEMFLEDGIEAEFVD